MKKLLIISLMVIGISTIFLSLAAESYVKHIREIERIKSPIVGGRVYFGQYEQQAVEFAVPGITIGLAGIAILFYYHLRHKETASQNNNSRHQHR